MANHIRAKGSDKYSIQGQKLDETVFRQTEPGAIKAVLNVGSVLPSGMYFIKAGGARNLIIKVTVY